MNISDNILKEQLKNVYFLSGGAYGGKTTMAKLIEKKYGLFRFRQGDHSAEYAARSDPKLQPTLNYYYLERSKDWHGYFSRPHKQYYQLLEDGLNEEAEFAIIDLIKLSENRKVIADVGISPEILKRVSEPSRVILLFAPEYMTRKYYFDREDKQDLYHFIKSFPDGNELMQNVVEGMHYGAEAKRRAYYDSGFYCIERREDDTIERTLKKIEEHFGLS